MFDHSIFIAVVLWTSALLWATVFNGLWVRSVTRLQLQLWDKSWPHFEFIVPVYSKLAMKWQSSKSWDILSHTRRTGPRGNTVTELFPKTSQYILPCQEQKQSSQQYPWEHWVLQHLGINRLEVHILRSFQIYKFSVLHFVQWSGHLAPLGWS